MFVPAPNRLTENSPITSPSQVLIDADWKWLFPTFAESTTAPAAAAEIAPRVRAWISVEGIVVAVQVSGVATPSPLAMQVASQMEAVAPCLIMGATWNKHTAAETPTLFGAVTAVINGVSGEDAVGSPTAL